MTDTASYERNRPAALGKDTSSEARLRATARYLSARIARLLGVEQIPIEDLAFVYERSATGGEPAQAGTGLLRDLEGAAGLYHAEPSLLERLKGGTTHATIAIDKNYGGWGEVYGDPGRTTVLAHELTHAYLLRNHGLGLEPWVQESMAQYIPARLGYPIGLTNTAGDVVENQYTDGARFMLWLDEHVPDASLNWARLVEKGIVDDEDALESVTGTPTPIWLAAYYQDPYVKDGEGSLSRFLTIKSSYSPQGQRTIERVVRKSEHYRALLHRELRRDGKVRGWFDANPGAAKRFPSVARRYGLVIPPNKGENTTPTEERTTASDRVPIDYSTPAEPELVRGQR